MPLVMDVHNLGNGVSIDDGANAHQADLATQGEYHVSYLRCWVDERKGQIFCLVEPDAGAATEVHARPIDGDTPVAHLARPLLIAVLVPTELGSWQWRMVLTARNQRLGAILLGGVGAVLQITAT
jgi:Protein of unknown function (DUF4242)